MKKRILRYWLAMNASAFDAAVNAAKLFCCAAGGHDVADRIPSFTLEQFVLIFLLAFGNGILNYLSAHPLANFFVAEMYPQQMPNEKDFSKA